VAINFQARPFRALPLELTTMNAEYPIVDDYTQGQEIKHVGEVLPDDRGSVLPYTFRIEPVCLSETAEITINDPNQPRCAIEWSWITSSLCSPSSSVLTSRQDARHFSSPFFVRPPPSQLSPPGSTTLHHPPNPPHRGSGRAMQGLVYLLFVGASTSSEKGQS
jgi:hypothetical protein